MTRAHDKIIWYRFIFLLILELLAVIIEFYSRLMSDSFLALGCADFE